MGCFLWIFLFCQSLMPPTTPPRANYIGKQDPFNALTMSNLGVDSLAKRVILHDPVPVLLEYTVVACVGS
jgi:hypothetical protein